jgi:hypothetical protein
MVGSGLKGRTRYFFYRNCSLFAVSHEASFSYRRGVLQYPANGFTNFSEQMRESITPTLMIILELIGLGRTKSVFG